MRESNGKKPRGRGGGGKKAKSSDERGSEEKSELVVNLTPENEDLFVTVKEKDCNKCPEGIQYF
jgi:hypothetical protein